MQIVVLDFETVFDSGYSLSCMTTDGYVLDPRFKAHGVAVQVGDTAPTWWTHAELAERFAEIDWSNTALLAHNVAFDGFILKHVYGCTPAFYLDTLSMARAVVGVHVGAGLDNVAKHFGIGHKTEGLLNTKGKRDLTFDEEWQLSEYAINDLRLCRDLFDRMKGRFSSYEMRLIDMTIRMFVEPTVWFDEETLANFVASEKARKDELLQRVGATPASLRSAKQFAELLWLFGVEAPTKPSPSNPEKQIPALAKSDEGFQELLASKDDAVRWLAEARLAHMSNLNVTRAERFLQVARANRPWPVLLNYYGAGTTGRWSGGNSQNPQNMPRGGQLRAAVKPPPGYKIVVVDSSQIEARKLAYIAAQNDLLDVFREKGDPYSRMASAIYGRPIVKGVDKDERQVGKCATLGCFTADTQVLTKAGWKPIVDVSNDDLLWDGIEWVTHLGLVNQGIRGVERSRLVGATPDHLVLTLQGWKPWRAVHTNPSLWRSALSSARLRSLTGADTLRAAAACTSLGQRIAACFSRTWYRFLTGTSPSTTSTASTTIRGTSLETSDSFLEVSTPRTSVASTTCSAGSTLLRESARTYDIAYAGPRNRFTILSSDGPLIVHNCGYGMSAEKFMNYVRISTGIRLDLADASKAVFAYRTANKKIVNLWYRFDDDLHGLLSGGTKTYGCYQFGFIDGVPGIRLPNNLWIKYPKLRQTRDGLVYTTARGDVRLWGSKCVENVVQALARIVVAEQMLSIEQEVLRDIGGRVWLMAHDEICMVVPEASAEYALERSLEIMHRPPAWANTLPVAAEGGIGDTYGSAKG